jgi:hypothetical protein
VLVSDLLKYLVELSVQLLEIAGGRYG